MPDLSDIRARAIEAAIADIRTIESDLGVTERGLDGIRSRLIELASRSDIFSLDHFPPPRPEDPDDSYVYRLWQDEDDRFALYIQATDGVVDTKPHDHTTWACIVGLTGQEHNRFYARTDNGGVAETGEATVEIGTGITMMPEDVHAIRIDGRALMFHCYGLALERLVDREFFDVENHRWVNNAGPRNIIDARERRSISC